jgi:AraC family transcriptional regulator
MFRHTTGVTLSDFIAGHRLRLAKRRLADRHASIKSIAYECGFSSPSSFTAAFRRATRSPRQYRSEVFDAAQAPPAADIRGA